jgi:hypothetical protein
LKCSFAIAGIVKALKLRYNVLPYISEIVRIIIDTNIAIIKKLFMFPQLPIGHSWTTVLTGIFLTI